MFTRLFATALLLAFSLPAIARAEQLRFSGYDFKIKQGNGLGPGPNDWAKSQAFVDGKGRLHLRFSEKNGKWYAGEIQSVSKFGFGTYEIEFTGDIGGQDKNVVFGFFNYPSADVGPDATNEIDVEFARWGNLSYKPLNYTVWPAKTGLKGAHKTFGFPKGMRKSIHRFVWKRDRVIYYSAEISDDGNVVRETSWAFKPDDFKSRISSSPMAIYFNLWGFQGRAPSNGNSTEVIVNAFKFTPAE